MKINILQKGNKIPIQNVKVGKFIGDKPFRVYDTEIGRIKKLNLQSV